MPELGQLLFNLVQNWENEFSNYKGMLVIALAKKLQGYASCDEFGNTDFMPSVYEADDGAVTWFVAVDQDTIDAFLGETKVKDGKTFCKVVLSTDPEVEKNLNYMLSELQGVS